MTRNLFFLTFQPIRKINALKTNPGILKEKNILDSKKNNSPLNPELFIRDHLAGYRTELANRRTMLAYIRTALALVAAALVFIKFWHHPLAVGLGWALLPVSAAILIQGFRTYRKINQVVRREEEKTGERETPFLERPHDAKEKER